FIKTRRVENFISVWRLKKPTEVCLSAGSSFLLEVTDRDADDLSRLVENGLGERTHEGFGKCALGWQTEKTMAVPPSGRASGKTGEPPEEKFKMPGNVDEMPKTTHEILTSLARREMEKRVALTAMKDQKRFRGRPPNALIGRLKTMSEQMTPGGFRQTLEKLRKSARDKLERCVSTRKSLLEFLKGKEIS
ncbi:MAG: hypothetical protein GY859_00680, partial [Desulfobacterales bacterium]|nr:hypothetical protein [Desulfobacterales bacterium]